MKLKFNHYWETDMGWAALVFILRCAEYKQIGNGIESGFMKRDHYYWLYDDGRIELFRGKY